MQQIFNVDLAVILIMYLSLCDLGYMPGELDLSDPSLISKCGPHRLYTIPLLIRDDVVFPEDEFSRIFDAYSNLSTVKPLVHAFEYYPACVPDTDASPEPETGMLCTKALRNFSTLYITAAI